MAAHPTLPTSTQRLLVVQAQAAHLQDAAQQLAQQLGLRYYDQEETPVTVQYALSFTTRFSPDFTIELQSLHQTRQSMYVDFTQGNTGYRLKQARTMTQPLVRAVGAHKKPGLTLLDVTAGLGQDAMILALSGAKLQLMERNAVIASLLQDGLRRAKQDAQWQALLQEVTLQQVDALGFLQTQTDTVADVIYMDPMYPHRKKSALVKKEMRIIRDIVGDNHDAEELLRLALQKADHRVVVKRPQSAPHLGDIKPHHYISSKNTRYDVYQCS